MKNFLILHYGFEKPTSKEIAAWNRWFESIAKKQVDRGGLRDGREINRSETKNLPFTENSLTGYTIIEADDLDEAEGIAKECPIIDCTKVYEIYNG